LHSGIDEAKRKTSFCKRKFPVKQVFGLKLQKGLGKIAFVKGINIVCFDLHWPMPIFWGIIAKSLFGVPLVFWGHGFGKSKIAKALKCILVQLSDGIILYSFTKKKELVAAGIPLGKIFVAPNSIFVPNSKDFSFSKKKKYFLYLGRLQNRKKLEILMQAFSNLKNKAVRLKIVGDGKIKRELIKLARLLKIEDRVDFIRGSYDPQKIQRLFEKAIAYVSPGACGLGIIHSFAYGVPVVTCVDTNHGPEIEMLKNGENGLILKTTKCNELANSLEILLTDKNLALKLGRNAFLSFKKNSPEVMINSFNKALNSIQNYRNIS
jgi:glycosyltransferase involved in cell wall biosynthesis